MHAFHEYEVYVDSKDFMEFAGATETSLASRFSNEKDKEQYASQLDRARLQ